MNINGVIQTAAAMIITAALVGIWNMISDGHNKLQQLYDALPALQMMVNDHEQRIRVLERDDEHSH